MQMKPSHFFSCKDTTKHTKRTIGFFAVCLFWGFLWGMALGNNLADTVALQTKKEIADGRALPIDQTDWHNPQSSFMWVAMARDYKMPWDSFGRQGWMTDDAYVLPVDPGVSEFTPDTQVFYIVFAISALDAPSQYRAAWYYMPDGKNRGSKPAGTDALTLEMNEKSGYLEIYQPSDGWQKGKYLIRLFFESPGQELYDPNVVGTMEFTITDHPRTPLASSTQKPAESSDHP